MNAEQFAAIIHDIRKVDPSPDEFIVVRLPQGLNKINLDALGSGLIELLPGWKIVLLADGVQLETSPECPVCGRPALEEEIRRNVAKHIGKQEKNK